MPRDTMAAGPGGPGPAETGASNIKLMGPLGIVGQARLIIQSICVDCGYIVSDQAGL